MEGRAPGTEPTSLVMSDGAGPTALIQVTAEAIRTDRSHKVMSFFSVVAHKRQRLTHVLSLVCPYTNALSKKKKKSPFFIFSFIHTEMDFSFDFTFFWGKS